jgi:hypothetical protein
VLLSNGHDAGNSTGLTASSCRTKPLKCHTNGVLPQRITRWKVVSSSTSIGSRRKPRGTSVFTAISHGALHLFSVFIVVLPIVMGDAALRYGCHRFEGKIFTP